MKSLCNYKHCFVCRPTCRMRMRTCYFLTYGRSFVRNKKGVLTSDSGFCTVLDFPFCSETNSTDYFLSKKRPCQWRRRLDFRFILRIHFCMNEPIQSQHFVASYWMEAEMSDKSLLTVRVSTTAEWTKRDIYNGVGVSSSLYLINRTVSVQGINVFK